MKKKSLALATALAMLATQAAPALADQVNGSGSTAAQPYFQALFAAYRKVQPSVNFQYQPDGGNAGVKDVQAGTVAFAGQSVPPVAANSGTTFVKLFEDGLCIDVNPSNNLTTATLPQISNIFTGNLTSWSGVPGSGLSTTIDAYGRNSTAGTYTFFTTAVLNGATQGGNVTTEGSDGLVANAVKNDANGIGYIGLAYQGSGLKSLSINGVACNAANIQSNTYPLNRFIWLVLPSSSQNPEVVAFANWVVSSPAAAKAISATGGVPYFQNAALAKALAVCAKKPRSKRAACIAAAKKKY